MKFPAATAIPNPHNAMPQKGLVTITVNTFRQVATTLEPRRYCAVDVAMPPLPPPAPGKPADIEFFDINGIPGKNGKFRFNGPASLEIEVKPRIGVNAKYVPVSVAFRRSDICNEHPACDVLGRGVLEGTISQSNGSAPPKTILTIDNKFNHGGNVVYEFFILIQRESDGALGLIDPDIENKEEN